MAEDAPTATRPLARWLDGAEVVLGAYVALSTLWVDTTTKAMWTMVVLGVLIALDGLWSLAAPHLMTSEGIEMVLGVLLFISPWVMGYSAMSAAAWTSWIVGALAFIAGGAALTATDSTHHVRGMNFRRLTGQH